jgi:DNA end-binding protein Ku
MRSIWNGSIGFGLVNIPVKLYSATQQSNLDLDMLDRRDMGKIQYQRINENTGRQVKWEDIAKAYKLDDKYIMLDEADYEEAAPEKSKIIEVNHFVNENEIDTIYYENSYYIEPESSGVKAYALLREALAKSGKVGVAQFVLRTASVLTIIKPLKEVLILSKIRFAEEIRSTQEIDVPTKTEVKPAELKMAMDLIDQYTSPFDIKVYKDEYAAALLRIIKDKAKGKKPQYIKC